MNPFAFVPAGLMSAGAIACCAWVSTATALPAEKIVEVRLAKDRSCTPPSFFETQDRLRVILAWDGSRVIRSVGGQEVDSDTALIIRALDLDEEEWVPIPIHVDNGVPWAAFVTVAEQLQDRGFSIEVYSAIRR